MPDSAPTPRLDVLLAQAGWVRGLARALVLDPGRVDDVVQKTWLAALEPRGGVPYTQPDAGGVILGLDRVFSISEWGHEAGTLAAGRVRAGRQLLLSGAGILKILDVQPEAAATIELGTARVTIERPDPDDPLVYLLPEEASSHPAARYFARRSFGEREQGRVVFAPIPAGRYVIVVDGRDTLIPIEVQEGQELAIARERWLGSGPQR